MAGQEFGKYALDYDKHRPHFRDGQLAEVAGCLVEKGGFLPGDTVVEIGSGTGLGTEALLEHTINVVGVEPDEQMLAVARRRFQQRGLLVDDEAAVRSSAQELPTVCFVQATLKEAVDDGLLVGPYDGVAAFTSIHWPVRLEGLEATAQRIAGLLRPGGRLAALHTPLDIHSDQAAAFVTASRELWPAEYANIAPGRKKAPLLHEEELDRRRNDYRPYLEPVSHDTWTDYTEKPVDEYLNLAKTYWEMLELPEAVRAQLLADLRRLSIAKFGGRIPVAHATLLQVDEKPAF